jgi:hypothetical protein
MPPPNDDYLAAAAVSTEYPGLTPKWLQRQRWDHKPPTHAKLGRVALYRRSDIEAFLAANTVRGR